MNFSEIVANYVALRDEKSAMEKAHEEQMAPVKEALKETEAAMLDHLNKMGVTSMRTPSGTILKVKRTSVTVGDWDAAWKFIHDNEYWHFIEHRLNKSAVEAYIQETNKTPPGANINVEFTTQFRRS